MVPSDAWNERITGQWPASNSITACNTEDECPTIWQPGGCLQISTARTTSKIIGQGRDPTGLGRWVWTRYRGIQGIILQVITAYLPCTSTNNTGVYTIHCQHQRYLDKHRDPRTPRQAMLEDLCEHITKWRTTGYQMIVMMDLNEDITSTAIVHLFSQIGLKEAITTQNGPSGVEPTYNRGSYPIDGIYTSSTLVTTASGYLPFGEFPSDHRGLWLKVDFSSAFGAKMDPFIPPAVRRLNCDNPTWVKKFQNSYESYITQHKLHLDLYALHDELTVHPFTPERQSRYESLVQKSRRGIFHAEQHCRSLKMGEVPWSRVLQESMDTIKLWSVVLSRKKGTRVSTRYISRLEQKVHIKDSLQHPLPQVTRLLTQAYHRYYELKKNAAQLRESWLKDLAALKAKHHGGNQEGIYKSLLTREKQRRAGRRLRRAMGKLHSGLTGVQVLTAQGPKDITDKEGIENACHDENRSKYSQTSSTPMVRGQLGQELGFDGTSLACQAILAGQYQPPSGTDEYTTEYLKYLKRPLILRTLQRLLYPHLPSGTVGGK